MKMTYILLPCEKLEKCYLSRTDGFHLRKNDRICILVDIPLTTIWKFFLSLTHFLMQVKFTLLIGSLSNTSLLLKGEMKTC